MTFSKKCKNMSTKQEIVSDVAFKGWPFSSNFNFICKDGWVTAATCKHYCPLAVNRNITNCCKELHLKYGRVPRSVFEPVAMHKNQSSLVWKPEFFLISKWYRLYQKLFCFSVMFYSIVCIYVCILYLIWLTHTSMKFTV